MKRGEIFEGTVAEVRYMNRGRVPLEAGDVWVKNTIPGQKIRFRIQKKKAGLLEGQLLEILAPSSLEKRPPACSLFGECGGCLYQTLPYQDQLSLKENQIRTLLTPFLEESEEGVWEGILSSPREFQYRNKMEFSFGDAYKGGPMTLGLHRRGSTYDVLEVKDCAIVHPDLNRIASCVLAYFRKEGILPYNKTRHSGCLRHLMLRRAGISGEILIHLVTTSQEKLELSPLVDLLKDLPLEGTIVGILHLVNDSLADIVQSDETTLLWGRDYFEEDLLGLKFHVSTFSFFQPNSFAAEVLYDTVRRYARESGSEKGNVFDLYSGTGTIAQLLAPAAQNVTGVEIVEEAVQAARENAARNGLSNCRFLCGDVLKTLDCLEEAPSLIVLDPPRDGIHPKALGKILAAQVPAVIYISCKATSLARDLPAFLHAGYHLQKACCVDQFCQTCHVETVCLLSNRKPDARVKIDVDLEDYYRIKDEQKKNQASE